jgi:hypothetical protein
MRRRATSASPAGIELGGGKLSNSFGVESMAAS